MIIKSLLENDFYKFSMQQAVLHNFPDAQVEVKFKCRSYHYLLFLQYALQNEIRHLCSLSFDETELDYLGAIPFLKKDYIDFLRVFKLQEDAVTVYDDNGQLGITIRGSWLHVILFEVPILAIVNELYFRNITVLPSTIFHIDTLKEGRKRLCDKIAMVNSFNEKSIPFKFADFGMRRRFSSSWHKHLVEELAIQLPDNFIGTSNVFLAKEFDVKYIGTMAHEWLMCGQSLSNVRLVDSQKYMLDKWVQEYRGDLGIALSDTLGFDAFLRDFDKYFSKLYDGCRHDSGDPYRWCEKLIQHYIDMGIDPTTKSAVFSDGLNFELALNLAEKFHGRIKTSFGIGTNLTNDVSFEPLQIVMKIVKVNNNPVAKLSDSSGKGMCEDAEFLRYLKKVFKI